MKRPIILIVMLLCLLASCKSDETIVHESSASENSVIEESIPPESKTVSELVKTQLITFPANDDDGETEFNAHIYEIEPFDLSLALPDGWSLDRWPLAGGYGFITAFSKLNFFNEKGECVGVIGYNIYELYEGAEDNPMAIYGQIAIGNNYQFNVKNSYKVVNETDSGVTATVDVYYAAVINDGVEKNNKGIVSYNKDLLVYIAAEFNADRITDEQLTEIAKSIQISRNA